MIPQFNDEGNLPTGIHPASWEEICQKYGNNIYRKRLLRGLKLALDNLKSAGCTQVFLDGSFITSKRRPNDFDVCWEPEGTKIEKLDPVFSRFENGRKAQKTKYGGEFFPKMHHSGNGELIIDFFQQDRESGNHKGIISINMEELS
jgi:hypothetical protein